MLLQFVHLSNARSCATEHTWYSAASICVGPIDDEGGKQQDWGSVPAHDLGCAPQVPQWTHQQSQCQEHQGHLARDLFRGVHVLSMTARI